MNERDEFIVDSGEDPQLRASDELTGWEMVVFELDDEEPPAD